VDTYADTIRAYYRACDARDAAKISSFFVADAAHYFPGGDTFADGTPQEAFRGAEAIGRGFADGFQGDSRAYWHVDRLIEDLSRREAVIEWSNFKPLISPNTRLRGAEWYHFDENGLITEIRAYYACPMSGTDNAYELQGFDYAARGYSVGAE
jgi:methyltransferase